MRRAIAVAAGAGCVLLAMLIIGCGGGDDWVARDVPSEYPTIQAAVDAAEPGDLVRIAAGVYREEVVVPAAKQDIVLRGVDRNRVILDGGKGRHREGIVVHGDGIAVENLTVRGYGSDGILVRPPPGAKEPLRGWRVSYVTAADNGVSGVNATGAEGGWIEHVLASGHGEAGLRIARCQPCDARVSDSVAVNGQTGFEGVDAGGNIVVARSEFRDNRVGLMLQTTVDDETFHQQDTAVVGNVIADNDNRRAAGRGELFGVGVVVRGGRRDGLARNLIRGHPGVGVLLTPSEQAPTSEINVQGNLLRENELDLAVLPTADHRGSQGSCFAQNRYRTSMPGNIEKSLPCQSDVPIAVGVVPLPPAPPRVDWRDVALPGPQPQMPGGTDAKPQPARKPSRIDVAKIGVPGAS